MSITIPFISLAASSQSTVDEEAFRDGTYDKSYIIKNNIRSITAVSAADNSKDLHSVYFFSKQGLLKSLINYDSTGKEFNRYIFTFTKRGDLEHYIIKTAGSNNHDTVRFKKVYSGKLLTQESSTYSLFPLFHSYNQKGLRISTTNKYISGSLNPTIREVKFEYDENGRVVHATERIADSATGATEQWISDRSYTYINKNVIIVKEKILNGYIPLNKGNLTLTYNSNGMLLSYESDAVASKFYQFSKTMLLTSKLVKFPKRMEGFENMILGTHYSYTFW